MSVQITERTATRLRLRSMTWIEMSFAEQAIWLWGIVLFLFGVATDSLWFAGVGLVVVLLARIASGRMSDKRYQESIARLKDGGAA